MKQKLAVPTEEGVKATTDNLKKLFKLQNKCHKVYQSESRAKRAE
jgi:hypothetical protein